MPMSNQTSLNDVRLDRAIDRAVRELMQVDPEPGMRRRVLSRINAPVERPALPWMRYAFVPAALMIVVLSISLLPGQVEPPAPPKAPPLVFAGGAPPIVLPDLESVVVQAVGSGENATPTYEAIPMPPVTDVFGAQRSGVSAATVREPATIRVAPETLTPLTIVPLSARPIVIEPLVVDALQKGGR